MSPNTQFALLALVSSVLAIPYAGHHGHAAHQHAHKRQAAPAYGSSLSSPAAAIPYPYTNGTTSRSSELSPQSPTLIPTGHSSTSIVTVVPIPYGSSSSEADAIPTTAQSSSANGLPTAGGSSSTDITTTTTVRSTSTRTSYTTIYLSKASSTSASEQAPASSVADSNTASAYKEVKQAAADTAAINAPTSTDAEQCSAVTVTATEKITKYITVSPSSSVAAPVADKTSAPLTSAISITSTVYRANTTQYAPTAYSSASCSISATSSNSSEAGAIPATSSSAPAFSAPAYSAPSSSSSSEAAPVATSESPKTTAAAIIPTAYVNKGLEDAVPTSSSSVVATSTSSAAASYSSTAPSTGGKRGLAYNDASLTDCFTGSSEITWAYNWGSSAGDLASGLNFIPTLWGTGSDFTGSWSKNAKSAISSGSTHLFSFNEPDLAAQANLSPAAAAAAYKTYMQPLAGSAKMCAPSVTNSGSEGQGLSWLSEFLEACSDCTIDCINIHWYDSAEHTDYFKSHIEDATKIANGKPIFVSEFAATGSDEQISSFLEEVMPYMDSNSNIAGYAYFMVQSGALVTGTEPSTYGSVYKSYTA